LEDRQGTQARAGQPNAWVNGQWLYHKEPLPFCAICTKAIDLYNYGEQKVEWHTGNRFPKQRAACLSCVEMLSEAIGWREPVVDNWLDYDDDDDIPEATPAKGLTMADALRQAKRGRGRMAK